MNDLHIIEVEWIDSCSLQENRDVLVGEAMSLRPQITKNIGYLLADDEEFLLIAGGLVPSREQVDYPLAIPRVAVRAVRRLQPRGK